MKSLLFFLICVGWHVIIYSQPKIHEAQIKWSELLQIENYPSLGKHNGFNSIYGVSILDSKDEENAILNFALTENSKGSVCGNQIRKMNLESGKVDWKRTLYKYEDASFTDNYSFHSAKVEGGQIELMASTAVDLSLINNYKYASRIVLDEQQGNVLDFHNSNSIEGGFMTGLTGHANNFIYQRIKNEKYLVTGVNSEYVGNQPLGFIYFKTFDGACRISDGIIKNFHYKPIAGDSLHWSFFSPPQPIRVNDTLVAVLHYQRSFKLGNINQKHRYQLALINIKNPDHLFEVFRINLEDHIPEPFAINGFEYNFFDGQNIVLSNYFLVNPNSLDDKARYLIKINLEGQIVENYQHLQYKNNAYSSRLIYFGKYKGKDLYGGFPSHTKRLGYDLFTLDQNVLDFMGSITENITDTELSFANVHFSTFTDQETIVICAQKNTALPNGNIEERNYLFALDLNDIIDFQTNTENTILGQNKVTLYPNPVNEMLKVDFEYPYEGSISIHDASLRSISVQKTDPTKHWELDFSSYPNGLYFVKLIANGQTGIYKLIKI